ncbi:hypothetical protein XaraCFBP7407_22505, partial [Xanthomonas arboricola pv. arracaciae]
PNLLPQSLQEIDMGLGNSKPSVAGSPEHYATHATEQAAPSESPSPSRRDSPSPSNNALREALPPASHGFSRAAPTPSISYRNENFTECSNCISIHHAEGN